MAVDRKGALWEYEKTTEDIHQELLETFITEARVKDPETGYIIWEGANREIYPQTLKTVAMVVRDKLVSTLPDDAKPNKVMGITNRGRDLAPVVGLVLDLPILVSERLPQGNINGHIEPKATYDQEKKVMTVENVPSFTKNGIFTHQINCLEPGDRVLVIDDWCAYGSVTLAMHEALDQVEVKTSFAYLVAKDLPDLSKPQQGYRKVREAGINAFAILRVTGIVGNRVTATTEDIPA